MKAWISSWSSARTTRAVVADLTAASNFAAQPARLPYRRASRIILNCRTTRWTRDGAPLSEHLKHPRRADDKQQRPQGSNCAADAQHENASDPSMVCTPRGNLHIASPNLLIGTASVVPR